MASQTMSLLIVLIEGRFAGKIKIVLNHYVVADVFFLFFIKLPSQPLVCTRGGGAVDPPRGPIVEKRVLKYTQGMCLFFTPLPLKKSVHALKQVDVQTQGESPH